MPERQLKKDQFRLNRGLNTESNEVSFPDGFTTDERNYELLVDGSRRRRKALDGESGGSGKAVGTITSTQMHTSFKWRSVGGDPDKAFIVHQVGATLYFTDDAETISTTYHANTVDLTVRKVDSATTDATVANTPCQFAFGRGHLFVVNKYLEPFYIKWDSVTDDFTAKRIDILIRDFDGIDDGVGIDTRPTGTITDDHRYNLRNRGWKQDDMDTFFSDLSDHPSKNMLWYRGYRRQTDVSFSDIDGIQVWSSAKIDDEAFGNASAAQGSLFLNPLDTRFAAVTAGAGLTVPITVVGADFNTGSATTGGTFRLTVTGHGRSDGEVISISGSDWEYETSDEFYDFHFNGIGTLNNPPSLPNAVGEASIVDANTIDIYLPSVDPAWTAWESQSSDGQLDGGEALAKSDGAQLSVGPTATAFHAGRIWYAGIDDSQWNDTVFFSKIAQKPEAYGICHQEMDPTDENFNQLSSSDGGTIVVPNLGKVQRLLSVRDSLLIFSDQGVWEIGGGQRGVFTAGGYSVRKISNAECSSPLSPISIGSTAIYTGPRGIHQIAPNEFTSVLEEQNISEQLIQTLWNDIPAVNQKVVQTTHDDALNRVYFLYGDSGLSGSTDNINQYANALILDLRVGAWYKYVFAVSTTSGVVTAYAITDSDTSDSRKKIKWSTQSTNSIVTADFDHTDFIDFGGAESPLPFMVTGWDNIGDFQSRRQAPVITVYSKRTETGYTQTGNGWDADNESSTLMSAFWDWTEAIQWDVPSAPTAQETWDGSANNFGVSGKIGSQNEVYRHVRGFVPLATSDSDGYPVVVTRNKVRGRGRVLQLRFDGSATKDSHLLGFTTNYKVSRMK
jgi:hypothetical protein